MLHIDNSYSLGAVYNFEEDEERWGLFLTVDLLKAAESEKERIEAWESQIKQQVLGAESN